MLRVLAPSLILLAGGCASAPSLGIPYPFSHGLLNPESALLAPTPARRKRTAKRRHDGPRRRAARCRARVGRRLSTPRAEATRSLLACTAGKRAARGLRLNSLELSQRPQLGDIVIFDDARDANGNGKLDDPRSDAGVVVSLRGPLVRFVYLSGERLREGVLHLRRPGRRRVRGRVVNSYVRTKTPSDAPRARYLAGELLSGFARLPTL